MFFCEKWDQQGISQDFKDASLINLNKRKENRQISALQARYLLNIILDRLRRHLEHADLGNTRVSEKCCCH